MTLRSEFLKQKFFCFFFHFENNKMNVLTGVDKWSVWIGKFSGCESHSSSNDILGKKITSKIIVFLFFFFFSFPFFLFSFFFDNSDLEKKRHIVKNTIWKSLHQELLIKWKRDPRRKALYRKKVYFILFMKIHIRLLRK